MQNEGKLRETSQGMRIFNLAAWSAPAVVTLILLPFGFASWSLVAFDVVCLGVGIWGWQRSAPNKAS